MRIEIEQRRLEFRQQAAKCARDVRLVEVPMIVEPGFVVIAREVVKELEAFGLESRELSLNLTIHLFLDPAARLALVAARDGLRELCASKASTLLAEGFNTEITEACVLTEHTELPGRRLTRVEMRRQHQTRDKIALWANQFKIIDYGGEVVKYRRFGRTGWQVSEVGYGMWGMGGWSGSDDEESMQALQQSVDLGCNFFDTARAYGDGHSESLLGRLIRNNHGNESAGSKRLYVATKVPPKNQQWPSRREYKLDDCFPPDFFEQSVEASLKDLGIETIDLIQFHTWEDSWIGDDRWIKKVEELKKRGLIRAVGISINRWEPWNGVRAVREGLVDAVQVIYNIFDQAPEDQLFPACREHDVAVIARVPFDEGSLTGTLTRESTWPKGDWRNTYFVAENLNPTIDRVERLKPLVPPGMTLPEFALRFILMNPDVSTIIPGMRKPRNVISNMAASDAPPLPEALYSELRKHRWDRKPAAWSD